MNANLTILPEVLWRNLYAMSQRPKVDNHQGNLHSRYLLLKGRHGPGEVFRSQTELTCWWFSIVPRLHTLHVFIASDKSTCRLTTLRS